MLNDMYAGLGISKWERKSKNRELLPPMAFKDESVFCEKENKWKKMIRRSASYIHSFRYSYLLKY